MGLIAMLSFWNQPVRTVPTEYGSGLTRPDLVPPTFALIRHNRDLKLSGLLTWRD